MLKTLFIRLCLHLETVFQYVDNIGQSDGQNKVNGCNGEPDLKSKKGFGYNLLSSHGEIVHGKRSITADTALRLGRYFGMEAQFWLNLQTRYDLLRAEEELDDRLNKEVTPHAA